MYRAACLSELAGKGKSAVSNDEPLFTAMCAFTKKVQTFKYYIPEFGSA